MTSEYSVACLLDVPSHKYIQECIHFLEKGNRPHISLFQFKCDEHFLVLLKNYVRQLKISSKFLSNGITIVEENLFLNIMDDSSLQAASDLLAELYFTHCQLKEPLSQIKPHQLNYKQTNLVKKYGIYWIKEDFRPHVTLSYDRIIYIDQILKIPESITINNPDVYLIDYLGRIVV